MAMTDAMATSYSILHSLHIELLVRMAMAMPIAMAMAMAYGNGQSHSHGHTIAMYNVYGIKYGLHGI